MTSDIRFKQIFSTKKPLRLALQLALVCGIAITSSNSALAGPREQAKRMHDRLAGIPPTEEVLCAMTYWVDPAGGNDPEEAAMVVMNTGTVNDTPTNCNASGATIDNSLSKKAFYSTSLKNFVTPWTNEAQSKFEDLNDYSALVIGMVRDDVAFDEVLSTNFYYRGNAPVAALSADNNDHFKELQDGGYDLSDNQVLVQTTQDAGILPTGAASAGVVTTRAASLAFFTGGTNRLMWRATSMNFLCRDLEQMKDVSRTNDRIRQDVSRSPGGDSSIYLSACMGCHAGMDPLAGAYAYYDHEVTEDGEPTGHMLWKQNSVMFGGAAAATSNPGVGQELFSMNCLGGGCHTSNLGARTADQIRNAIANEPRMSAVNPNLDFDAISAFLTGTEPPQIVEVTAKYLINSGNFPYGYVTVDDGWVNYWREGLNSSLKWGWSGRPGVADENDKIAFGNGAATLGYEVTSTQAFAQCQVEKVYKFVCLQDPIAAHEAAIEQIRDDMRPNYNMKNVFAKVAPLCMGD